ncbi:MAG: hypothetical protein J6K03_06265, partial [Oscillospiraceae bacterium]|nr:hypothetical protein [Oscillospiraceae bacterium]
RGSPDPRSHECRSRSGKVAFALFSGKSFGADFMAAKGKNCIFSVGPIYKPEKRCLHLHIPKQKIPTVDPPMKRGKTMGIFTAAFLDT